MKSLLLIPALLLALAGPASAKTIKVEDGYFSPEKITVKKGSKVTWAWAGSEGHTLYVEKMDWMSPLGGNGFKWKKTFRKRGTFTFYCIQHPGMQGSVKVK